MGKRKEYRKIIKNYKEQKIVFQEEMKLDYSKLEETIAEAIKIEKERENENKRKHSKKRELLYKTLNIIFYMVLMIIVLSCIFRKNRALASHERSAVPIGTDHCPVG